VANSVGEKLTFVIIVLYTCLRLNTLLLYLLPSLSVFLVWVCLLNFRWVRSIPISMVFKTTRLYSGFCGRYLLPRLRPCYVLVGPFV